MRHIVLSSKNILDISKEKNIDFEKILYTQ